MTAQAPDVIILDGQPFSLQSTPLQQYFDQIKWRPSFSFRSTTNHRGYVARWEIFGRRLFLTGLFCAMGCIPDRLLGKLQPDPDPYEPAYHGEKSLRLVDLFPAEAPLVPAT